MNANIYDGRKYGSNLTGDDKATALDVLRKMQENPRWASMEQEAKDLYAALEAKLTGTSDAPFVRFDEEQINVMIKARAAGQI